MRRDPWQDAWQARDRFSRTLDAVVYACIAGAAVFGLVYQVIR